MATGTKSGTASSNGQPSATAGAAAVAGTKAAGKAITTVASKAKAPLIAGGAAAAGLAGGLALTKGGGKRRRSRGSVLSGLRPKRRSRTSLDLDSATAAAKRVGSYGQQIAEVADAVEKTRKRHR